MDAGGFNWSIIVIVGPLLMVLVFAWAVMKNRKSSRREIDRTEHATRDLYRQEDNAHRNDDTLGT
jgi:short subunit fatty acids transporter